MEDKLCEDDLRLKAIFDFVEETWTEKNTKTMMIGKIIR